jgi:DNA-binding NtrC family response regulator
MSNNIILIGENTDAHQQLIQSLGSDGYNVLPLRTLQEAMPCLRDASFPVSAVICTMTMRRQHDFDAMAELAALRPQTQTILVAKDLEELHSELRVNSQGLYVLQKSLSHQDAYDAIREVIHASASPAATPQKRSLAKVAGGPSSNGNGYVPSSEPFLMRVGKADVPVLLHGETGVGKEVMARRLCAYSARANKPFLKLNCAALPSELIESELFGYEKGAFTGATMDKPGKFEIAQGGTILLDEIGDMDIRLQAKLLTVLQDGEIQPLGSRRTIKVNVRVMAATHRDLRKAIEDGSFREDLYYRLNVINIVIPPLRDRRHEILPLAEELLRRHLQDGTEAPEITEELQQMMLEHTWPGNVRELENTMRRFLVFQDASMLVQEMKRSSPTSEEKPAANHDNRRSSDRNGAPSSNVLTMDHLAAASRQAETKLLLDALEATRWNRRQAAARLNIEYKAFLYKLQKYRIAEIKAKAGDLGA